MKLIFAIILLLVSFLYSNKLSDLYFEKACDKDIAQGCYNLGLSYLEKDPYASENIKAIIVLDKACKLKLGNACYKLASMYEKGKGAKRNKTKAKLNYKRGCLSRHTLSCRKYHSLK